MKPNDLKLMPRLRYLRRPHECNYCHKSNGMTFSLPGRFERRLHHVRCRCGKKHYACMDCAGKIGSVTSGTSRFIAKCAKGYNRGARAAGSGTKGGR